MKLASLLNHISVGGRVCRGRIRFSNIWGPSLLGAEFVRGRVCQGPSLSGAEMSRNLIGPPAKRRFAGVPMMAQLRMLALYSSLVIFQRIQTSIAKKPYILWIFALTAYF